MVAFANAIYLETLEDHAKKMAKGEADGNPKMMEFILTALKRKRYGSYKPLETPGRQVDTKPEDETSIELIIGRGRPYAKIVASLNVSLPSKI